MRILGLRALESALKSMLPAKPGTGTHPPLFEANLTHYSWKQMDCQLSRPTAAHCLMNLWDPLHFLGSIPSKELRNSGKRFLIFATELRTKRDRFISRNVP